MKNFVQKGRVITLAAPYDRSAGQGALVGSLFGVAAVDVLSGVSAEFQVEGVFDLTKASGAVTQGAKIYWDNSAKNCTTTATSNTLIGVATQAQASGDATVRVRLGIVA
jgi:predicted RecA/RadA family phage recombinase